MINKKTFIFATLAEALKFKIGANPSNTTYRFGSFAADAAIETGEPDIPYYSEILIRETNQIWRCNQFWLNDVERSPDNDLATERAERTAADTRLQEQIDSLSSNDDVFTAYQAQETKERTSADTRLQEQIDLLSSNDDVFTAYQAQETKERKEADENLQTVLQNQQEAIASLGLRVDGMAAVLITMEEYRAIKPKLFQTYYVARDETDKAKLKCWRIYLRSQLIGEFESSGKLTLPKFPMRFPFRFA